jgi:hypothetical protein
MRPGSSSRRCQDCRPRPPLGWPAGTTPGQWEAIETGVTGVTKRVLTLLPPEQPSQLADGPVTIDLDAIDAEAYGRKKRGVA